MNAGIIYRGPSLIDGAPIVAVATFTINNKKTGAVVQTYILRDDMDPLQASKTGADRAICGDCPLRGVPSTNPKRKMAERRACYVTLGHGPLVVWKALARGFYADAQSPDARAKLGAGRVVRLGTYGDPAAVPRDVWADLLRRATSHTGYTHNAGAQDVSGLCMISAETLEQAQAAWAQGRRTFRLVKTLAEITPGEVLCPASEEAGRRVTCAECRLCGGQRAGVAGRQAKSIAIVAHGSGAGYI